MRVNKAYADGDASALAALAEEWEAGPLPGPMAELLRSEELYARLEWLARRKEMLAEMAAELEESAIGAMLKLAPDDPDPARCWTRSPSNCSDRWPSASRSSPG